MTPEQLNALVGLALELLKAVVPVVLTVLLGLRTVASASAKARANLAPELEQVKLQREQLTVKAQELETKQGEALLTVLKDQMDQRVEQAKALKQVKDECDEQIDVLRTEVEKRDQTIETLSLEVAAQTTNVDGLTTETLRLQRLVSQLEEQAGNLLKENGTLKAANQEKDNELKARDERIVQLQQDLNKTKEKLVAAEGQIADLEKRLKAIEHPPEPPPISPIESENKE